MDAGAIIALVSLVFAMAASIATGVWVVAGAIRSSGAQVRSEISSGLLRVHGRIDEQAQSASSRHDAVVAQVAHLSQQVTGIESRVLMVERGLDKHTGDAHA